MTGGAREQTEGILVLIDRESKDEIIIYVVSFKVS